MARPSLRSSLTVSAKLMSSLTRSTPPIVIRQVFPRQSLLRSKQSSRAVYGFPRWQVVSLLSKFMTATFFVLEDTFSLPMPLGPLFFMQCQGSTYSSAMGVTLTPVSVGILSVCDLLILVGTPTSFVVLTSYESGDQLVVDLRLLELWSFRPSVYVFIMIRSPSFSRRPFLRLELID